MTSITLCVLIVFSIFGMPAQRIASAAAPAVARTSSNAGPIWRSGPVQYSNIINCVSIIQGNPYYERGLGAYASQLMAPDQGEPIPGQVYYLRVYIAGLGRTCSGTYVRIDMQLPANTSLAISGASPVLCFSNNAPQTCPQSLPASALHQNAFYLRAPNTDGLWPFAQGTTFEARIPVVSNAPLTDNAFNAILSVADGNSSPTLVVPVGVYVFKAASPGSPPAENPPTFAFSTPSTISITTNSAQSEGYIYTFAFGGDVHIDYGPTNALGQTFFSGPVTAGSWRTTPIWGGLTPGATYFWRIRFVGSNGQTYLSAIQSFAALAGDTAIIGDGTPAQCTETALLNQLGVTPTRNISFDCGPLPIMITLSSQINVPAGNKYIDGGNKVTLQAPPNSRHFNVDADIGLYLTDMTLTGGAPSSGCGGAIRVQGGYLALTSVRLIGNRSALGGGALCLLNDTATSLPGRGVISGTLFLSNTAATQGGGAIWLDGGNASVEYSDFTGNIAEGTGIGGAVGANPASIDPGFGATRSLFFANRAAEGGAIRVTGRQLRVYASTVSGNQATGFGGGIFGNPNLINSTLANNSAGGSCQPVPGDPQDCATVGGAVHGTASAANSVFSNNMPANCGVYPDPVSGDLLPVRSNGNNISSDASCALSGTADRQSLDPQLQPLAQNDGRTRTHALGDNSPAINAGANSWCGIFNCKDQRGLSPFGSVDIGAFERQSAPISPTPTATPGPGTPTATVSVGTATPTPGPGTPTTSPGTPAPPRPTFTALPPSWSRLYLPVTTR